MCLPSCRHDAANEAWTNAMTMVMSHVDAIKEDNSFIFVLCDEIVRY